LEGGGELGFNIFLLPLRIFYLFFCCLLSSSPVRVAVVVPALAASLLSFASFGYNDWPARLLDNEAIFLLSKMNFQRTILRAVEKCISFPFFPP
jgi:hypothetical protein